MKTVSQSDWNAREARFDALTARKEVVGLEPAEAAERRKLQKMLCSRKRRLAASGKVSMPSVISVAELNRRIKMEDLKAKEIKNAVAEGKLVEAAAVRSEWLDFMAALRTHLEALPARYKMMMPFLTPDQVTALRRCLDDMARDLGFIPPAGDAGGKA